MKQTVEQNMIELIHEEDWAHSGGTTWGCAIVTATIAASVAKCVDAATKDCPWRHGI